MWTVFSVKAHGGSPKSDRLDSCLSTFVLIDFPNSNVLSLFFISLWLILFANLFFFFCSRTLTRLGFVQTNLLRGFPLTAVSFFLRFSYLFQLLYVFFLFRFFPMFYSDPLNFLKSFLLFSPQIQTINYARILSRSKIYLKILGFSSAVDLPFATLSWVSVHLMDKNVCGLLMDAYTVYEPFVDNCSIPYSISGKTY